MKRKLYDLAHARAGDKGNTTILSLIAYKADDFALLRELSRKMSDTALCKLEARAPGPMLTTLERFPDEYRAHAERGECLSGFHDSIGVAPLISPLTGIDPTSSAQR